MRKRYSMNLGAHMAECDANYARLIALAPALCKPGSLQTAPRKGPGAQAGRDKGRGAVQPDLDASLDSHLEAASSEFTLELPASSVAVLIELVERSRYTTLVRFTQLGPEPQEVAGVALNLAPPTMLVRLYHDARSAEVVEVRNESRFKEVYEYPNPRMRSRDEKAQVNRFLGEYLAMCLRYGMVAEHVAVGN